MVDSAPRLDPATNVRHRSACDGSGGGGPGAPATSPPSMPVGTECPLGRIDRSFVLLSPLMRFTLGV